MVGEVVRNDVEEDAEAEVVGLGDQRLGLGDGAEKGLDRAEVRDVVASVLHWGRVPRGDPQGVDAEPGEVREARAQPLDVADAVTVSIREAADVDLVDDRAPPPWPSVAAEFRVRHARGIAVERSGGGVGHAVSSTARSAHSPAPFGHGKRYSGRERTLRYVVRRSITVNGASSSVGSPPTPSIAASSSSTPRAPVSRNGWRTVVRPSTSATSTSSKPITARSSGTRRPPDRAASSTPIACTSEAAKIAVGGSGRLSSRSADARASSRP